MFLSVTIEQYFIVVVSSTDRPPKNKLSINKKSYLTENGFASVKKKIGKMQLSVLVCNLSHFSCRYYLRYTQPDKTLLHDRLFCVVKILNHYIIL